MRQEQPWLWSQAPLWLAVGKQSPQEAYWDLTKQDRESTSTITAGPQTLTLELSVKDEKRQCVWVSRM